MLSRSVALAEPASAVSTTSSLSSCFFFVSHDAIEEGGRRQLLIVADDHDPLGAGDEAERILRAYLARFVDDK